MTRKIASHYALIDGQLKRNIVVELNDENTITNIIETKTLDSMAGLEFYPGILIPAMVNAHCHLELSYLHNKIEEGTGFAGFARAIGALRNNFSNAERIHAAEVAAHKMWAEGIGAVADIANDELIMEVKSRSKIVFRTMFEHFGLTNLSTEPLRNIAMRHRLSSLTPHSTYSVQDAPFREICSDESAPLSLHLLESEDERLLYHHSGSLWEWYERMGWECDFLHYGNPTTRIVESTPANRAMLLVHGTLATSKEVVQIERHTSHATWVLCPESNRYISRLQPPVAMLKAMGATIAIGTDSLASARSLSMVENMRMLGEMCDAPLCEILTWATYNGAKALGLEQSMGSIERGKSPGLVVVEGADLQSLRLTPETTTRRVV